MLYGTIQIMFIHQLGVAAYIMIFDTAAICINIINTIDWINNVAYRNKSRVIACQKHIDLYHHGSPVLRGEPGTGKTTFKNNNYFDLWLLSPPYGPLRNKMYTMDGYAYKLVVYMGICNK